MKTLLSLLILAAPFTALASPPTTTFTNLPNSGTNIAGLVTNTSATQICIVQGSPAGVSSPLNCAIWPSGGGFTAGASTNTFTFANSKDGVTLANTNFWSVTLVCNNGTNVISGYDYVAASNYTGAMGFGLINVTIGGTNGFTNGGCTVTWPN